MDPLKRKKKDKVGWQKTQLFYKGIISYLSLFISLQHSGFALHAGEWEERERERERERYGGANILIMSIHYRWGRDLIGCIALHACSTGMMIKPCTLAARDVVTPCANHVQCFQLHKSCKASFTHHTNLPYIDSYVTISINPKCDACREEYCDFTNYKAHFPLWRVQFQTWWGLHFIMIQVKLNEEEEEEVRTHPNHQHPLLLFENMPGRLILYCPVCGDYYLNRDIAYGCIPCLFFIHKSCFEMKLPLEIQHFYQPHLLSICTNESDQGITCKTCCEHLSKPPKFWYYSCKLTVLLCDGYWLRSITHHHYQWRTDSPLPPRTSIDTW